MTCKGCEYFSNGSCRRFPPIFVERSSGKAIANYPETAEDAWCGEWRERVTKCPQLPPSVDVLEQKKKPGRPPKGI